MNNQSCSTSALKMLRAEQKLLVRFQKFKQFGDSNLLKIQKLYGTELKVPITALYGWFVRFLIVFEHLYPKKSSKKTF
jgi:hypothetical protein